MTFVRFFFFRRNAVRKRINFGWPLASYIMESLILAQNERWRRVLSMQVERQQGFGPVRVANG